MALYTIRQGFTVFLGNQTFTGGQEVDLTPEQFEANKHKLEGVGLDLPDYLEGEDGETANSGSCLPTPFIGSIDRLKLSTESTKTITIKGSFFTPSTTVATNSDLLVIDSVEFVNSLELRVTITTLQAVGEAVLTIDNGKTATFSLEVFEIEFIDLRSGGTEFSNEAIEVRDGMSWQRTSNGLKVSGSSGWGRWLRLVGDQDAWVWNRSEKRNLALIAKPDTAMFGIGSRAINPNSNAQYREGEFLAYVRTNYISGFYGNNGSPGTQGSFPDFKNFQANAFIKLVLENNGELGAKYYLYELPSGALVDWEDESNLILEGENQSIGADEPEIMPFFTANSVNFELSGFYFF